MVQIYLLLFVLQAGEGMGTYMTKEMEFFIYLLEHYANHKNKAAIQVLQEWDADGITQKIYGGYPGYHTERIENAYEDIDSLLNTGKHAW